MTGRSSATDRQRPTAGRASGRPITGWSAAETRLLGHSTNRCGMLESASSRMFTQQRVRTPRMRTLCFFPRDPVCIGTVERSRQLQWNSGEFRLLAGRLFKGDRALGLRAGLATPQCHHHRASMSSASGCISSGSSTATANSTPPGLRPWTPPSRGGGPAEPRLPLGELLLSGNAQMFQCGDVLQNTSQFPGKRDMLSVDVHQGPDRCPKDGGQVLLPRHPLRTLATRTDVKRCACWGKEGPPCGVSPE